jgi:cell division protein ZapA
MRRVDFTLNGRSHSLNCEDGQERRVSELAAYIDSRMKEVTGGAGGNDVQNLLVTCMVLADELQEARTELQRRGSGLAMVPPLSQPTPPAPPAPISRPSEDTVVIAAVDGLAKRIEDIAARLERT